MTAAGAAVSRCDQPPIAVASLRGRVPGGGRSTDRSCALRSVAEMGLSARTREKTGHCSNAGGLSAVL
ncbi:MAG: hypothetical protein AUI11_01955 [Acidobacteria bacterium 13_2_20CM_2_66_4]|nr:MAG: hypothetical protein AUI11_01955 [Acidobacteria bacterium 13_2_20CM_2_66_4]